MWTSIGQVNLTERSAHAYAHGASTPGESSEKARPRSASGPLLVGDVGGTHLRLAYMHSAHGELEHVRVYHHVDAEDLGDAMERYLSDTGLLRPRAAAIGVACAVVGDLVALTNHALSFSVAQTRERLGLERLCVMNDFTALARALPTLPAAALSQIGPGTAHPQSPIVVLGPGTGLGVAGLIPSAHGDVVVAGEGGHATLAATDAREEALFSILWRRFGHLSAERVLSGAGLLAVASAIAELRGVLHTAHQPADVLRDGLDGSCPICCETLHVFCAVLGSVAGNAALTLGARGGVFIGGGIVPRLGAFFAQSAFRERFELKGRLSGYLRATPTFVICDPYAALRGAARALCEQTHSNVPG